MKHVRVIPVLLLERGKLVKTVKFQDPAYVGDPINALRIFNDKEVDEVLVLDIGLSRSGQRVNLDLVARLAGECFMPMGYGGGISTVDDARAVFGCGVEKLVLNTAALHKPGLMEQVARMFGAQAVVVSVDVRRNFLGRPAAFTHGGTRKVDVPLLDLVRQLEQRGAGELIINSIDRDGTMQGYDVPLIHAVSTAVRIPVVACGGAARMQDFVTAMREGRASAVAAGAMFVFNGKHRAVLISYPGQDALARDLYSVIP